MKHLIIGGARSGKSRFAETCAGDTKKERYYLATAEARDREMADRIAHHQARRNSQWTLVEEPIQLALSLQKIDGSERCIIVDCLTLWLSNCLERGVWAAQKKQFLGIFEQLQADVILVGNEVGGGIVPLGEISRQFVDENGWLHQNLAEMCEQVSTVIAGQPLILKAPGKH